MYVHKSLYIYEYVYMCVYVLRCIYVDRTRGKRERGRKFEFMMEILVVSYILNELRY